MKPRVVVVTGASAGVGRATVRAFAREGTHVGLIARDTEGFHVAAREVNQQGGKGLAVPATSPTPIRSTLRQRESKTNLGPSPSG
jgi:NAD(P)-dependent dehydrogenase (short-subunit alcohol dehydrogenase family)